MRTGNASVENTVRTPEVPQALVDIASFGQDPRRGSTAASWLFIVSPTLMLWSPGQNSQPAGSSFMRVVYPPWSIGFLRRLESL